MPKVKRLILGVTGGIASGKTTVIRLLARRGIPTISSDDLAHAAIRRGRPAYRAILRRFGRGLLHKGQINRVKLGDIVFSSASKRKALERIIHPHVISGLKAFIKSHPNGVIALDIPLLFEAKLTRLVDKSVVVYATPAQQLARLRRRTGLSRGAALARICTQMPLSEKCRRADIVIRNTGKPSSLHIDKSVYLQDPRFT